jgi:Tol biopolymer transport system component
MMSAQSRRCSPDAGAACNSDRIYVRASMCLGQHEHVLHPARCTPLMVALVLVGVSGVYASAGVASPSESVCSITQITSDVGVQYLNASISGTGSRVVFRSLVDPAIKTPGLFLFDAHTGLTTLLTGEAANPFQDADIDETGEHIVAPSRQNLTGENADGSWEIFLFDTRTATVEQITHALSGGVLDVLGAISGDGARISFASSNDLTGQNPDRNREIFFFDTRTGSFTQVTRTTGFSNGSAALNGDGTRIVFGSSGDLTGQNPDGNSEIFLFDASIPTLTQLTRTSGIGQAPSSIDREGTRIAFTSTGDFTGENLDGNYEIFLVDTKTGIFTQVTRSTAVSNADPSLSADGTRTAFISTGDFSGENPDGNYEVFLFDTKTAAFTQVTRTEGRDSHDAKLSSSGTRLSFRSGNDLTGGNPDGSTEIFLATCGVANDFVSLEALTDTFRTSTNTAGCPAEFTATFSFAGRLMSLDDSPAMTDVRVQVQILTNGNLLQNADGEPGGIAATLTVPRVGGYADGVLGAGEAVDVPFIVCLRDRSPFQFFVDVLGDPQ